MEHAKMESVTDVKQKRTRLAPEARRAQILESALVVFGRDGYRDGSLQEVAATAGLTQQGLLHYFPSKTELLLATLDHWQELAGHEFGPDIDIIDAGRLILQRNLRNPGVMRLRVVISAEATSEGHPAHERMMRRYSETHAYWSAHLADGVARGLYVASLDVDATADALIALLDGLQLQHLLRPESDIIAAYDALVAGLMLDRRI